MLLIKSEAWSSFKYLKRLYELKQRYSYLTNQHTDKDYRARVQKAKMCYLPTRLWGTHTSVCKTPLACKLENDDWLMWNEEHQTWEEYRSFLYLTETLNDLKFVRFKYLLLNSLVSLKVVKHKFKVWVSTL